MKKLIFIILITLWALGCGGLFSCNPFKIAHQKYVAPYILPVRVYRVEVTKEGYRYLYVYRYKLKGRIPSTCVENAELIQIGDIILVDTRLLNKNL